jgi:Cd2+/Zn2+-exporting ATPase/Cu+-exporting ATPase
VSGFAAQSSIKESERNNPQFDVVRLCLMATASGISLTGLGKSFTPVDMIAIVGVLLGGYPVYKETFQSLIRGRINMEVSMAIAIFASLIVGQYAVSALITFFVLLSEYIENFATDKCRSTVVLLERSVPKKALVRRDGIESEVGAESLLKGDVVIVRVGERIPVDGTIISGTGFVNQSAITGESSRLERQPGDAVYAGSVNESGVIEVRTEKVGSETVFGRIIELVAEAESKKAPIQKVSDKLATWLVELAVAMSAFTFLITRNLTSTISVVVVAGACGVAAGTPLAIVAVMGKAAKKGAIVKGGLYVEELNKIDTVVIDKTGTLTLGEPQVIGIKGTDGHSQREVLQYAAIAERHSNHPLARAISARANQLHLTMPTGTRFSSSYLAGKGVISHQIDGPQRIVVGSMRLLNENNVSVPSFKGALDLLEAQEGVGSTVFVAHSGEFCGSISIGDTVRGDSRAAIDELKKLGIHVIMLTGDNKPVADYVGRMVGIGEIHSQLLPQDKVALVEKLVAEGKRVAMVGDGVNDAPALARANVGIGMGAGTDVSIEEADVVLMTNDLRKIAELTRLSKKAYRVIMTNFIGTIAVDGLGVTLAALGLLNPLLAAAIHVVSELVFILNSARLIR